MNICDEQRLEGEMIGRLGKGEREEGSERVRREAYTTACVLYLTPILETRPKRVIKYTELHQEKRVAMGMGR